jgi:hypothetical protein
MFELPQRLDRIGQTLEPLADDRLVRQLSQDHSVGTGNVQSHGYCTRNLRELPQRFRCERQAKHTPPDDGFL